MANRLSKQPAITYTEATPPIPYQPAYCVWEPTFVQRVDENLAMTLAFYNRAAGKPRSNIKISPQDSEYFRSIGERILGFGMGNYTAVYELVCFPERIGSPGVAPTRTIDQQLGWNSGGRSRRSVGVDGYASFQMAPRGVGIVCGLSTTGDNQLPSNASHAFYLNQGNLYIMENGVIVTPVTGVVPTTSPVLKIVRDGTQITYQAGTFQYTSLLSMSPTLPAYLDVSLYAAGDFVENPVIANMQPATATGTMGFNALFNSRPRATATMGFDGFANALVGNQRNSTATATMGFGGTADALITHNPTATAMMGFGGFANYADERVDSQYAAWASLSGDRSVGVINQRYAAWGSESTGNTPVVLAGGVDSMFTGLTSNSILLVGEIGGADMSYSRWASIAANKPVGAVQNNYSAWSSDSFEYFFDEAIIQLSHGVLFSDEVSLDTTLYILFNSVLELTANVTVEVQFDGDMAELLMFSDSYNVLSELELLLRERLLLDTSIPGTGPEGIQYAVNTQTGALTRYDGFDFYATVSLPDRVLGAGPLGFYELARGEGNDGEAFSAFADLGQDAYGSLAKKHMDAVYVEVAHDGQVYVQVEDDNGVYRTYRVNNYRNYPRAQIGKGKTSREWGLLLRLEEVTDAELNSLEVVFAQATRRWTR